MSGDREGTPQREWKGESNYFLCRSSLLSLQVPPIDPRREWPIPPCPPSAAQSGLSRTLVAGSEEPPENVLAPAKKIDAEQAAASLGSASHAGGTS
ncbi:hypothetical protein J6590_022331 [Homalodisca vitripennis]|nr:hypothetical protein J6590_022331 [Homalodisca vitripennis]